MKKVICFLIFISIFFACKKEPGAVLCKISYTDEGNMAVAGVKDISTGDSKGGIVSLYSQFGRYITSITPDKFSAKFMDMRFMDAKAINLEGYQLTVINGNWDPNDPNRLADFSNKSTVSIVPEFGGGPNMRSNGVYADKEIRFIYFFFLSEHFFQEFALPEQYRTITLNQLSSYLNEPGNMKDGNILKFNHVPFVKLLFQGENGWPHNFVFGNTNTTTFYYFNEWHPPIESAIGMFNNATPSVWSDKFEPFILYTPDAGETVTINTVISFDIENLIQIYAGNDNISYTSDDIIVYAPNYWERISVEVKVN